MAFEPRPLLQGAAVHLWLAERGDPADDRVLGAEERARAARLQQPADRALFVLAHAVLRELLARYTGEPAADLPLSTGAHGKPRLPPGSHDDLRFNLSHSGDAVLVALARGRDPASMSRWCARMTIWMQWPPRCSPTTNGPPSPPPANAGSMHSMRQGPARKPA